VKTALVVDRRYQAHDPGRGHPESPERIQVILDALGNYRRPGLLALEPRPATAAEIALNHDEAHIASVAATAGRPFHAFDADTPTSSRSYETAILAAGGVLALLEAVMAGDADNGFAFVRPPGHHAEADRAMGFCLFNNVAIAARVLRERFGLARVLVVDWDVHHGNGTQHSFYDDPSVLYVSTHQYPFYPGTGAASEVGTGAAKGRTLNVPLPAGCGDDEYVAAFTDLIAPVAAQFRPEFVLISAGFDAHRRDPLAGMNVTEAGFRAMARVLMRVAHEHAGGRLAGVLEGGYDMAALRSTVPVVLDELAAATLNEPLATAKPETGVLDAARAAQRPYWDVAP
jgi:acetoin utilization deacetylase AcuC-like enzyme